MGSPDDPWVQPPPETLRVGPSRPAFFPKVPARWRSHAVAFLAFVIGAAVGVGAVLWWQERPALSPSAERADHQPFLVDEHAVEFILLEAAPSRTHVGGSTSEVNRLHVDSAFLLSGGVASTVLAIANSDHSLDVRVPALPVTLSPDSRYRLVDLEIIVQDCKAATRWTPVDRPFIITWRDEHGKEHVDRAGHYARALATSLIRYIDAECG